MDLDELKELLQILDDREIIEFELEEEGMKLRIRKASPSGATAAPALVAAPQPLVITAAAAHAQLHSTLLHLELGDVPLLEDLEDLLEVQQVHASSLG